MNYFYFSLLSLPFFFFPPWASLGPWPRRRRTHRGAAGLQQGALDDLPVLGVEGEELLHVGEGVPFLDVEAAPGALADSEVADLRVVAHCGEAQEGQNSARAIAGSFPPPCWLSPPPLSRHPVY